MMQQSLHHHHDKEVQKVCFVLEDMLDKKYVFSLVLDHFFYLFVSDSPFVLDLLVLLYPLPQCFSLKIPTICNF